MRIATLLLTLIVKTEHISLPMDSIFWSPIPFSFKGRRLLRETWPRRPGHRVADSTAHTKYNRIFVVRPRLGCTVLVLEWGSGVVNRWYPWSPPPGPNPANPWLCPQVVRLCGHDGRHRHHLRRLPHPAGGRWSVEPSLILNLMIMGSQLAPTWFSFLCSLSLCNLFADVYEYYDADNHLIQAKNTAVTQSQVGGSTIVLPSWCSFWCSCAVITILILILLKKLPKSTQHKSWCWCVIALRSSIW